jgi:hypothetical protein
MNILKKILRIPHALKFQYWKIIEQITHKIAPFMYDKIRYNRITGKKLNWNNPTNISEKLLWLNRYHCIPLKIQCADKYRMKEYINDCKLNEINVPLYGVWEDVKDIEWNKLPNQFVLKTNNGCGTNIICKDKSKLELEDTIRKLNKWLKIDYSKHYNEQHYKFIKPCIFAEEYLPSLELYQTDYKFQVINGEPYCVLVCANRDKDGHAKLYSYDLNWNRVVLLNGEEETLNRNFEKPKNFSKMIEYARILSKPFPYVRVDFYEVEGKLYIGELTFTPYGNIMTYYKDEVLEDMGNKLILPEKYLIK